MGLVLGTTPSEMEVQHPGLSCPHVPTLGLSHTIFKCGRSRCLLRACPLTSLLCVSLRCLFFKRKLQNISSFLERHRELSFQNHRHEIWAVLLAFVNPTLTSPSFRTPLLSHLNI